MKEYQKLSKKAITNDTSCLIHLLEQNLGPIGNDWQGVRGGF